MSRKINLIGVPLDLGVSKLGVDMGPTALRYAGIREAFEYGGFEYKDSGDIPVLRNFELDNMPASDRSDAKLKEIIRVSNELAEFVHSSVSSGELPVILGGDHSTAIGSVAGQAKANDPIGVIWIDAHPDANTPNSSPSGNIHGMPLAISVGEGYEELVNCAGFSPKVKPENVCIIGAKDIDPEEMEFVRKTGITMFTTYDIDRMGIAEVTRRAVEIASKGTRAVHVSFDADAIDMRVAPGTGIMTPGGLTYREISFVMRYIGENAIVGSVDVIEVNPLMDKRNSTAELCVELLMSLLGVKYSDYEKKYLVDNAPLEDEE